MERITALLGTAQEVDIDQRQGREQTLPLRENYSCMTLADSLFV
jgi:hypothetical protein